MQVTFVQLSRFEARWRQLQLTDQDLQALEVLLLRNPEGGAVVAGTGGLRKVRFAPPSQNRGKSGSLRVGYSYFRYADIIYLLAVNSKNEQANLTAAEKSELRKTMELISRRLRQNL